MDNDKSNIYLPLNVDLKPYEPLLSVWKATHTSREEERMNEGYQTNKDIQKGE